MKILTLDIEGAEKLTKEQMKNVRGGEDGDGGYMCSGTITLFCYYDVYSPAGMCYAGGFGCGNVSFANEVCDERFSGSYMQSCICTDCTDC